MDAATAQTLYHLADKLRALSVAATSDNPAGNSGHPTTCASCAEIMSVLFFNKMRYSWTERRSAGSDRFILSKGHAAPILYAVWALIDDALASGGSLSLRSLAASQLDLVTGLRKTGHRLEGHPTPKLEYVDVATGSLGQGLSVGAGMAYAGQKIDKAAYKTYVLLGDGECAEGSVYEAMAFAGHYALNSLVAIVDVNRLGQSEATMYGHDMDTYATRWRSFGWEAIVIDGHDISALSAALDTTSSKPLVILAQTHKGKGFEGIADKENWHGKPLANPKTFIEALTAKLPEQPITVPRPQEPAAVSGGRPERVEAKKCTAIPEGTTKMATRKAYGLSLAALDCDRVIACDAEVKNSTFAIDYKNAFPDRFVECFIAEQNLVGVTMGLACRDRTVSFASTFAAFFTRAFDQLRMGAISLSNANFVGSHCGVSIGTDGPSQMALEDLAMFRAIPNCTVLYPSDAYSMQAAVGIVANTPGMGYIRTTREETKLIYTPTTTFEAGKSLVVKSSSSDQVTIIGAGITLIEALKAYEVLASEGINVRIVDLFSVKPLDGATIKASAEATQGRVLVVEDHYQQGGIFEAVAASLSDTPAICTRSLAVTAIPCSGKGGELLDLFGISAGSIVKAVKEWVGSSGQKTVSCPPV